METGYIMADGGVMFGAVPKRAWQRKYAVDKENLCPLAMRCVLAISAERKILTDTGMGNKHLDKVSCYRPHGLRNIDEAVKEYGYAPEEITDVVLTHLHFDHCGGATRKDERGQVAPSFPNARYWLGRKQWASFLKPNRLEANSVFANNILPVYDAGLLQLADEDILLCEGFALRLFDGHSEGQLVACINTDEGVQAFPGDLIPTSVHVSLEWISAYDICALTALSEKERFLVEAEKEGYTLVYCHDAKVRKSKVKRLNDNFIATDKGK
ncbi:MAG: MBL fold metallo-hydrolase [Prevotella sp.]|nr:MBL fold metallo-hydrolase [Prevotella sp.]